MDICVCLKASQIILTDAPAETPPPRMITFGTSLPLLSGKGTLPLTPPKSQQQQQQQENTQTPKGMLTATLVFPLNKDSA